MRAWLRRLGGTALIPVLGLALCLSMMPFMAGERARGAAPAPGPAPSPLPYQEPQPPAPECGDDGVSGKRVMAVYVHGDEQTSRFTSLESKFQRWLVQIDKAFIYSAGINGGGWRTVRYLRDDNCRPVIDEVSVPQSAMETVDSVTAALRAMGYQRPDRKYIVWYEHPEDCGVGFGAGGNDNPDWYNLYNYGPHYAAVGTPCWGWAPTLHELLHTLGGVNASAPNATTKGHCSDDEDVLCYDDGDLPAGGLRKACKLPAAEPKNSYARNLIDCNGDDYFNTDPAPGSYLDTHWNVADSEFLYRKKPVAG